MTGRSLPDKYWESTLAVCDFGDTYSRVGNCCFTAGWGSGTFRASFTFFFLSLPHARVAFSERAPVSSHIQKHSGQVDWRLYKCFSLSVLALWLTSDLPRVFPCLLLRQGKTPALLWQWRKIWNAGTLTTILSVQYSNSYDAVMPASAFVYNWTVLVCIFICEPFNFNNSLNESVRIKFIPISISVFWLVTQVSNSVNKFPC